MPRSPTILFGLGLGATLALGCGPPPAADRAPDAPPLVAAPRDGFEPVADALVATCGTLDCHGQPGRNLRLFGGHGLRLAREDDPADYATSAAEYEADYWSVVVQPEAMDSVVRARGAAPSASPSSARRGDRTAQGRHPHPARRAPRSPPARVARGPPRSRAVRRRRAGAPRDPDRTARRRPRNAQHSLAAGGERPRCSPWCRCAPGGTRGPARAPTPGTRSLRSGSESRPARADAEGRVRSTVLIVDDDPSLCDLLALRLRRHGFETCTSQTIAATLEGIPRVASSPPTPW